MQWFRRNRAWGGGAALAAFALQFFVAFAHVHAGTADARHALPILAASKATSAGAQAPSGRVPPVQSDNACDICATVHLAGAALPAFAPEIVRAIAFSSSEFYAPDSIASGARRYLLAQSRAPPHG
jgi:hypothetical protein